MLRAKGLACGFLIAAAVATPSSATVRINIDLSNQRMHVESSEGYPTQFSLRTSSGAVRWFRHGGRLTAANHPKGGALFTLRLPLVASASADGA